MSPLDKARLLLAADLPIPVDLAMELHAQGIDAASLEGADHATDTELHTFNALYELAALDGVLI